MKPTTTPLGNGLALVAFSAGKDSTPAKAPPTNHLLVVDCSGSMSGALPDMRAQIKGKFPSLVGEKDTVSLIWFSGRGECGVIFEDVALRNLKDLAKVNAAVDRWLKPVGLTGFQDPLEEAARVIARLRKAHPGEAVALLFLSDGYDNQGSREKILATLGKIEADSAAVVEWGFYADRSLLSAMAAKLGGALLFTEDFSAYEPQITKVFGRKVAATPKKTLTLSGDAVGNVAFALSQGDVLTFGVEGGSVTVPPDVTTVYYLSASKGGAPTTGKPDEAVLPPVYAAISLFSSRMQPDVVLPLLKFTGDVRFITRFAKCFGKQKYSEFQADVTKAAFDAGARYQEGYDPTKVPDDNAVTVLDVLSILASDSTNRVLPYHPEWKYTRIGRAREDASSRFTDEETAEIASLQAQMSKPKITVAAVKTLQEKIASIVASKPEPLTFVPDEAEKEAGSTIENLVYNEDRPNVSLQVKVWGTVDLSKRLPPSMVGNLPEKFPTYIHRNYSIIRDGLVNVKSLPVKVSHETLANLKAKGVPVLSETKLDFEVEAVLDLGSLAVVNRSMTKTLSAKTLGEKVMQLTEARARQKVYQGYLKDYGGGKTSLGYSAIHGEEVSSWLKEQGITDYGGFAPKALTKESTDHYIGSELTVSLKGLSALPSLKEAVEKLAKGKGNAGALLMEPAIKDVALQYPEEGLTWLRARAEEATRETRELLREIAQIKLATVLGQVWFSEFTSLDNCKLTLKTAKLGDVQATFALSEVKIAILPLAGTATGEAPLCDYRGASWRLMGAGQGAAVYATSHGYPLHPEKCGFHRCVVCLRLRYYERF